MAARSFPNIQPTSRSYNPGSYPQTEFQAQNGATTVVRFGSRRFNSELTLGFQNITDDEASLILANFEEVNGDWDWVTFTSSDGAVGAGGQLPTYFREATSGLRWRYKEAPRVTSVFPGISTVECAFIGVLDGID